MAGMFHGTGSVSGRDEGPSTVETGGSGKSLRTIGSTTGAEVKKRRLLQAVVGKLKGMKKKRPRRKKG